jgi:hypothetical protein
VIVGNIAEDLFGVKGIEKKDIRKGLKKAQK